MPRRRLRRLAVVALAVLTVVAVASCHAGYHPLEVAAACRCSPMQYCHVSAAGAAECRAFPPSCADKPACGCLGRPIDACREELGAFTVLEPRSVAECSDCSAEEYCWIPPPAGIAGATRMCGLIPARCEDTPTCDCFLEARHGLGPLFCNEKHGRIEAGPQVH